MKWISVPILQWLKFEVSLKTETLTDLYKILHENLVYLNTCIYRCISYNTYTYVRPHICLIT